MADAYFLCVSGGIGLAVPLENLRELVETSRLAFMENLVRLRDEEIPLFRPAPPQPGDEGAGEPEAVALVQEKELTMGVLVDKMIGIRGEPAVRIHSWPSWLVSFCGSYNGFVEGEEGLFLLMDAEKAAAAASRKVRGSTDAQKGGRTAAEEEDSEK